MKVAIIYSHFPHYRLPVFASLLANEDVKFDIYTGDLSSLNGIRCSELPDIITLPTTKLGKFYIQRGFLKNHARKRYDAVIFLGDWKIISYWIYMILLKLSSVKVYLWTHGWLRRRALIHRIITNAFYALSDGLLVYGDRARELGRIEGFNSENIFPIYNSLDAGKQISLSPDFSRCTLAERYFLSVGRLIEELDLGSMLLAMKRAEIDHGVVFHLKIVGEGPCFESLKAFADDNGISVEFLGAIYDEAVLADLIYHAKAVVSPGKAGLVVMHSLIYGTPVITHNDPNYQMPEAEALVGEFRKGLFEMNDLGDLIKTLMYWWGYEDRQSLRSKGRSLILDRYTPERQVELIVNAVKKESR